MLYQWIHAVHGRDPGDGTKKRCSIVAWIWKVRKSLLPILHSTTTLSLSLFWILWLRKQEVKKTGITLKMFATLAKCQGLVVDLRYAEDATVDDFRAAVREACEEPADTEQQQQQDTMVRQRGPLLVVSYNRGVLQQTGTGHFSPIAAYDGATDRVLVLDTARFKYGSHWVDLSLLFRAMQPVDPDTNKSRGFALLSFEEQPEMGDSLPVSILVRTQKSQSPLRRLYKELLVNLEKEQEGPVTWEQVYDYWTLQGKDLEYVWKVMEPQVIPMDPDAEKQVDNVRLLLQELIPSVGGKEYKTPGCCRGNINRRLTLTDEEGIFLLYLASLSEDDRERAVNPQKATTTTEAQKQLLAEAALIQYAIETSDMMD